MCIRDSSIVKHTGSATEIGDNSSGSVLTLASGDADFTGNVEMQSGNSVGKFAVMSSAPHGSFDFYNNGTSYFNGAVTIDAAASFTNSNSNLTFTANNAVIFNNTNNNNAWYIRNGGSNSATLQFGLGTSPGSNIKHTFNGDGTVDFGHDVEITGAINVGGSIGQRIYSKNYSSLDTTGQAVAGLLSGVNGNSSSFVFETG